MRRNTSMSRGSAVPAALLNALQDEQEGLIPASDAPQVAIKGADGRWWNTPPTTGLASGATRVVDANGDWRNRIVWGALHVLGAADRKPGLGNDYLINDPTASAWVRLFEGWTGTGGVGAASATVADGTPPVIASGSYAVILDEGATSAARVWLYARPSDGALCLYNASGSTLHATLRVYGAAAQITGAPPPDAIPTLTLVQWLTPSLAAARPADPGGPALHRATDTGALTYFDGTTWRALGGGGGGVANPMTEDLDADGNKVKGLAPPTDPNDAATKGYVDAAAPPSFTTPTTNTTPTTLRTITTATGTVRLVRLSVTAVSDDGTRQGAWSRTFAFSRATDGTLAGLSSIDLLAVTSGSGWNPDPSVHLVVDIGASSVTVQVVGLAGVNILWTWKVEVI